MSGPKDLTALAEINALLGRGTEYEGKLTFEGRVRIDGKFKGQIWSADILILGEGADLEAEIEVGTLIVRGGVVRGTVIARDLVEIHAGARVYADVASPQLFVDKGAVFEDKATMTGAKIDPL
jgi:cytoskeletal protein CcmA (bactofilin family)